MASLQLTVLWSFLSLMELSLASRFPLPLSAMFYFTSYQRERINWEEHSNSSLKWWYRELRDLKTITEVQSKYFRGFFVNINQDPYFSILFGLFHEFCALFPKEIFTVSRAVFGAQSFPPSLSFSNFVFLMWKETEKERPLPFLFEEGWAFFLPSLLLNFWNSLFL